MPSADGRPALSVRHDGVVSPFVRSWKSRIRPVSGLPAAVRVWVFPPRANVTVPTVVRSFSSPGRALATRRTRGSG